ncbi:hypothetical protein CASFOL_008207 [Castilleja foliolosa]|uniref:Uncharacterized protein n=1 Tax=Castilleja foliolosa TaxID=1961234 RepID=A0ABD3E2B7_9LAMI
MVAGIDAAIEDGVDIISLSISHISVPFHDDFLAIGTFAAARKGIFVSCAAGNNGPFKKSIHNEAPWVLTVGASTTDRRIVATAKLGNGQVFDGESVYQPKGFPAGKMLPLVYGSSCRNISSLGVKGKVVLCDGAEDIEPLDQSWEVNDSGGAAAILANQEQDGFITYAEDHFLPAAAVSYMAGLQIKAYIKSTKSPKATILFKGTIFGDPLAPIVAGFSAKGPSLQNPGVLKPDIIGPGMNILAAWPFNLDADTSGSKLTFYVWAGTSMSTPHLAGVAALLKRAHPSWSPAAIKSAIMTTAGRVNAVRTAILDEKLAPADVLATGAGHVNPCNANDPGLVYDIEPDDYIPFICGLGYTEEQVGRIVRKQVNCTSKIPQGQLNYPTFSVLLGSPQTFKRTVTNVGEPFSHYFGKIVEPKGVKIIVKPSQLWFTRKNKGVANAVLNAIPTYYLSIHRLPGGVCRKLRSKIRNFLWGGSSGGGRKISWVSWEKMCLEKDNGGLGIIELDSFNKALLCKWGWRILERSGSVLWLDIIDSKYGNLKECLGKQLENRNSCKFWSSWWYNLIKVLNEGNWFLNNCARVVGNGKSTLFWHDSWYGGIPLKIQFPRLFSTELVPSCCVADRMVWVEEKWHFDWKWRRKLFEWEKQLELELEQKLLTDFSFIDRDDAWKWKQTNSGFSSVKSAYKVLREMKVNHNFSSSYLAPIWVKGVPLKVKAFSWKLIQDRIPTIANLIKRGAYNPNFDKDCKLCGEGEENTKHLFFDCDWSRKIWEKVYYWGNFEVRGQGSFMEHFSFHCDLVTSSKKNYWAIIWHAAIWQIWKARNEMVFNGKRLELQDIFLKICVSSFLWIKYSIGPTKTFSLIDWFNEPLHC